MAIYSRADSTSVVNMATERQIYVQTAIKEMTTETTTGTENLASI